MNKVYPPPFSTDFNCASTTWKTSELTHHMGDFTTEWGQQCTKQDSSETLYYQWFSAIETNSSYMESRGWKKRTPPVLHHQSWRRRTQTIWRKRSSRMGCSCTLGVAKKIRHWFTIDLDKNHKMHCFFFFKGFLSLFFPFLSKQLEIFVQLKRFMKFNFIMIFSWCVCGGGGYLWNIR